MIYFLTLASLCIILYDNQGIGIGRGATTQSYWGDQYDNIR